jgi:hypothetical protein
MRIKPMRPNSLRFWCRYFRAEWSGIKSRVHRIGEIAGEHRWQREITRFDSRTKFIGQWVSYTPKAQGAWPRIPIVPEEIAEACRQTVQAVAEVLGPPAQVAQFRKKKAQL